MAIKHFFKAAGKGLWGLASRRKRTSDDSSPLARVLNVMDLTLLGVGSTLGLGVYVLAGKVAHENTGPAVLVAFIVAAIASLFAGFCYAEFAARVPKAGSAYVYAYVAVGELVAFIIGWTLILEYAIGTASVTRGVSTYVDTLVDHKMGDFFNATFPIHIDGFAPYPDFFSFLIIVVMTALLAFGVKESSIVNNILTFLNLGTAVIAVVTAGIYANPNNWSLPPRPGVDRGGFFPFGVKGVVEGAGKCFFGFIGFDCIATTSEEAKNPRRNIPLSIVFSLAIICLTYCSISIALTLVSPYYELDTEAPFTVAFRGLGLTAIVWIVTIGAIFALTTSLLGSMIPLPRIMYAMASDGLLFTPLARVNDYTKTPLVATIVSGALSGLLVLLFDLDQLIDMMSIGTLLAYTVVGLCILLLRFTARRDQAEEKPVPLTFARSLGALVNWERAAHPTQLSTGAAGVLIFVQVLLSLGLAVVMKVAGNELYEDPLPWLGPVCALLVPLVIVVIMISRQPTADVSHLSFAAPAVPAIPAISLFLNLYLMVNLDVQTWVRFVIWMFVGGVVYFSYGMRHSTERLLQIAEKHNSADQNGAPRPTQDSEVTTHVSAQL